MKTFVKSLRKLVWYIKLYLLYVFFALQKWCKFLSNGVLAIKSMVSCRVKPTLMMILIVLLVLPSCGLRKLWGELNARVTALYQQGRYSEALDVAEEALKVAQETFGKERPEVAVSMNYLAELYRLQGKYIEAEALYKRALEINEKVFGPDHPEVAVSLSYMALLYYAQREYEETESLYERALKIHENALGPDHPEVALHA